MKIKEQSIRAPFKVWNDSIDLTSDDHLYFIKSGTYIKIGRSINVLQRLVQLSVGIPEEATILYVAKYKGCIESHLHSAFHNFRIRKDGEWFYESDEIKNFIIYLKNNYNSEIIERKIKPEKVIDLAISKPNTKDETIILIRIVNGIGIDKFGNGFTIEGKPLKRKFYNGRICFRHNGKVTGYRTLAKSQPVRIEIKNDLPF